MRLGLFGGTFDPIHLGHLILAEQCREACELDRVWFVVAGAPPHKPGDRTAVAHRLEMVRIAIAGHASFAVSEIETMRPGPHYSVETLEAVRRDQPDDDLFFLIGADSLADLPSWREPGTNRATGHDRGRQSPGSGRGRPGEIARLRPGLSSARCRSRSRRSASPRPTCAGAWRKDGAFATWSRAASKLISRRTGSIGLDLAARAPRLSQLSGAALAR